MLRNRIELASHHQRFQQSCSTTQQHCLELSTLQSQAAERQIAEMLPGMGQQLGICKRCVINQLSGTDATHQLRPVPPHVIQQGVHQVGFAVAMAQEQSAVCGFEGEGEPAQIVVIDRCALPCHIPIVAMGEVLLAGPEAMGLQGGVFHRIPLKPEHIGAAMVEPDHQAPGLVAAHMGSWRLGMPGGDAGSLQQVAHPQHIVNMEHGMVPSCRMMQPSFAPIWKPQAQSLVIQPLHLTPQGFPQAL